MTKFTTDLSLRRLAILAAIGVVAVACSSETRNGQGATAPVDERSKVNRANAAGEKVARNFLEAYGAFDAEKAMTYVADGADLTGLIDQVPADTAGLSLLLSFLKAQGYEQTVTSCEANTLRSDTTVVCEFDFHGIRSNEIGRGPFSGSDFTFVVRDGAIVRAWLGWGTDEFSPQMWEPFAEWVSKTHPKDFDVMYLGNGTNFRLTEESIRLWEQRSREYVKEVGRA
jgi:hypothetical protein